jgi:hypothetical protein
VIPPVIVDKFRVAILALFDLDPCSPADEGGPLKVLFLLSLPLKLLAIGFIDVGSVIDRECNKCDPAAAAAFFFLAASPSSSLFCRFMCLEKLSVFVYGLYGSEVASYAARVFVDIMRASHASATFFPCEDGDALLLLVLRDGDDREFAEFRFIF